MLTLSRSCGRSHQASYDAHAKPEAEPQRWLGRVLCACRAGQMVSYPFPCLTATSSLLVSGRRTRQLHAALQYLDSILRESGNGTINDAEILEIAPPPTWRVACGSCKAPEPGWGDVSGSARRSSKWMQSDLTDLLRVGWRAPLSTRYSRDDKRSTGIC